MVEPASELRKINAEELKGKMRSKEDWYKFLKFTCKCLSDGLGGFMVPSMKKLTMRFIKDFLGGKKDLLPTNEVNQVNVP